MLRGHDSDNRLSLPLAQFEKTQHEVVQCTSTMRVEINFQRGCVELWVDRNKPMADYMKDVVTYAQKKFTQESDSSWLRSLGIKA